MTLLALGFGTTSLARDAGPAALPRVDRVMLLQEPRPVPDLVLTDQDGNVRRLTDLRGEAVLLFFGFTNCPDVCPAAMAKFRALEQSGLIEDDRVSYVLVSVDGERDTPQQMGSFLARFSENFVGLTAPPSEVAKLARQFRAAFFRDNGVGHDHGYSVAHSNQIFLIDTTGLLRAELHDPSIDAMAAIVNALYD